MGDDSHLSRAPLRKSPGQVLRYLLQAMRPEQWIKNAPVFAGLVFAKEHLLTRFDTVAKVVVAFILFCFVSSAVYLINDVVDVENDRLHPDKRRRPIPAGDLSPGSALAAAILLSIACLGGIAVYLLSAPAPDPGWGWFGAVLAIYFIMQLAYIFRLKHIVLLDIFVIAGGFVLRAIAGAMVISVQITPWWLLSVFLLALFLGLGKRRSELRLDTSEVAGARPVLDDYSVIFIDYLLLIVVACTIVVYSIATFAAPLARQMSYPYLMTTIPFVIFALFRYLYLIVEGERGGEPAELLFRDRPFFVTILLWGIIVLVIQVGRV